MNNINVSTLPLKSYSTLGTLTNELEFIHDFSDMPDLEPAFISEPILDKSSVDLTNALDSSTNDLDLANALDPVFICEYQEKAREMHQSDKSLQKSDKSLQKSNKSLDEIKRNIEQTVNFNSLSESMAALNNPDILLNRIQNAFDSFKSQTGRTMTYSEMREMMG